MPYSFIYKDPARNWQQDSLDDFCPGLKDWNERFLDAVEDGKWQKKKRYYAEQKAKGVIKLPALRRGRIPGAIPIRQHLIWMIHKMWPKLNDFPGSVQNGMK